MPPLMHLGVANAVCAALLAALAWIVGRYVRRPALTHVLWLLVVVKLVTPPLFSLSLPWLPAAAPEPVAVAVAPAPAESPIVAQFTADTVWDDVAALEPAPIVLDPIPMQGASSYAFISTREPDAERIHLKYQNAAPIVPAEAPPIETTRIEPRRAESGHSILTLLGVVWITGTALWFIWAVINIGRFQRLLRHARPAPEHVNELTARIARQLGLRRCPRVALLPGPLPPMVWGALGAVRVLLPEKLLARLDEQQLASLLTHELAHVRRGDHWVRRLEFIVAGLYWWYPLVWWARGQLSAAEEECCDAWVVDEVPANSYAKAILETVEFLSEYRRPIPTLASGLGRAEVLKHRLTQILSGPVPKRMNGIARLAVACLALGLLPLLPTLAQAEKKPVEKETAEKQPVEPKPEPTTDRVVTAEVGEEAIALQNQLTLSGGDFDIFNFNLSPDGRYLAAGSGHFNRPGELTVWTVADHREVMRLATPKGIASVSFAPDMKHIVTGGYDYAISMREFPSGKLLYTQPFGTTSRAVFSPDGKTVAVATEGKAVVLLDAMTGELKTKLEGEHFRWHHLTYTHDGKLLLVAGGTWGNQEAAVGQVTIWDTATNKQVGKLAGHKQPILALTVAPDDQTFATGDIGGVIHLWQRDGFKQTGTLEGHENWVEAVTFTQDSKRLISGSHDASVRIWDVAKQMPIMRLDGHLPPVRALMVSPDGKKLYSGGATRMVKVWDLTSYRELATYQASPERPGDPPIILQTVYSPDGKLLVTALENRTIQIRSAVTGDLLRTLEGHDDVVTCLVFARDGKSFFSGSSDRTIRRWEVATGKQIAQLDGHTSWVYALAVSPDGQTLASSGYDKTIRLWDVATGKPKTSLTGHKGAIRALVFSPDGKTLASGAGDHTIKLWNLDTLQCSMTLTGHEGTVRTLSWSPDGRTLVSGSEDATARLWNAATGAPGTILKGHNDKVSAVGFSPRGRYILTAGMDSTLRLWDAETGASMQRLNTNDELTCFAWSPDGRAVVTGGYERQLKQWEVGTGPMRLLTGHKGPVNYALFSPDGRYILSCGHWPQGDKTLRLWDSASGKEIRQFMGHTDQLGGIAFSPDGKRIASGSLDKTIRLWESETGTSIRVLEGHQAQVISVAFTPDGKRLVSGSHDKTVRLWNVETGKTLHVFEGHTDWVRGVAFRMNGKQIVSTGRDGTVRLWDAESGAQVRSIEATKGRIDHFTLSPDGKLVALCCNTEQAVHLIDLETGEIKQKLKGHAQGVAFSPDGKWLLTANTDNNARLWDVGTGRELHVFRGHRNWVWAVNFSADGRRILTAGGGARNGEEYVAGNDLTIRIWPVPDAVGRVSVRARLIDLKK
jgi:WD40 repeat protein/beta-lactamase regulating signal transducer with metallopeptidase domain